MSVAASLADFQGNQRSAPPSRFYNSNLRERTEEPKNSYSAPESRFADTIEEPQNSYNAPQRNGQANPRNSYNAPRQETEQVTSAPRNSYNAPRQEQSTDLRNNYEAPLNHRQQSASTLRNNYNAPRENGFAAATETRNNGYSQREQETRQSLDNSYSAPEDLERAALDMLETNIPGGGVPGEDYPILASVPETDFACEDQEYPGYYADTSDEAGCQVFHICHVVGEEELMKDSFLCPNGTLFNQAYFVCDWWFNVDCASSDQFFELNARIGEVPEEVAEGRDGGYQDRQQEIEERTNGGDSYSAPPSAGGRQQDQFGTYY